jgi:hypothetical protein
MEHLKGLLEVKVIKDRLSSLKESLDGTQY